MEAVGLGVTWERLVKAQSHGPILCGGVIFGIFACQTPFCDACIHLGDQFMSSLFALDEL